MSLRWYLPSQQNTLACYSVPGLGRSSGVLSSPGAGMASSVSCALGLSSVHCVLSSLPQQNAACASFSQDLLPPATNRRPLLLSEQNPEPRNTSSPSRRLVAFAFSPSPGVDLGLSPVGHGLYFV